MVHPLGMLQIFIFFGAWMISAFILPICVFLYLTTGSSVGLLLLAAYYSFRAFVPRRPWKYFHEKQAHLLHAYPYFRRQETVIEEPAIVPSLRTLIVVHPHGILCMGMALTVQLAQELVGSDIHFMVTDSLMYLPLVSDMLGWYNVGAASKDNFRTRMKRGENLALIPGGFEEATRYERGRHRVFLKERRGFIKYALQHGYRLRPTYIFGEERTYWVWPWMMRQLAVLNRWKLPAVVFLGRFLTFMPDNRASLVSVIGAPIELPRIESPTDADVDSAHRIYTEALRQLFERHKALRAHEGAAAKLEIV